MSYKVTPTSLPGVLLLEPQVFKDERGFFFESFNYRDFQMATGLTREFVQDNHSRSLQGSLRGLHYQVGRPQGKLVRVSAGAVFDVVVDIRPGSPTFGQWFGVVLSADNDFQVWIPEGLAHGFLVLSAAADFQYKTTDYYAPDLERCIIWNDPQIGIDWPLDGSPILSGKDAKGQQLKNAELSAIE